MAEPYDYTGYLASRAVRGALPFDLAGYLMAKGRSVATGEPVDDVLRGYKTADDAYTRDNWGTARAIDAAALLGGGVGTLATRGGVRLADMLFRTVPRGAATGAVGGAGGEYLINPDATPTSMGIAGGLGGLGGASVPAVGYGIDRMQRGASGYARPSAGYAPEGFVPSGGWAAEAAAVRPPPPIPPPPAAVPGPIVPDSDAIRRGLLSVSRETPPGDGGLPLSAMIPRPPRLPPPVNENIPMPGGRPINDNLPAGRTRASPDEVSLRNWNSAIDALEAGQSLPNTASGRRWTVVLDKMGLTSPADRAEVLRHFRDTGVRFAVPAGIGAGAAMDGLEPPAPRY